MGDVSEKAGRAVELLGGLCERLEGVLSHLDEFDAAGDLASEVEARASALASKVSVYLASLGESVDPTRAPLLRVKRKLKAATVAMLSAGISEDGIRSAFSELVDRTAGAFPEDKRTQLGPTVGAAIDEALMESSEI